MLDFLEDIGLQLKANQISDELAHHHFYPTIQIYYWALKDYITYHQESSVYGKATWRYIEPLFERTFLIEQSIDKAAQKQPTKEGMIKFLELDAEKPPEI